MFRLLLGAIAVSVTMAAQSPVKAVAVLLIALTPMQSFESNEEGHFAAWAVMTQEAAADNNVWGNCLEDKCFKLLGPKMSLVELESQCSYLGGSLGSLHVSSAKSRMAHWHDLFDSEFSSQGLLYIGARLGANNQVATFSDGSIVTTEDAEEFKTLFSLGSVFTSSGGECIVSVQHKASGSMIWQPVRCASPFSYAVCEHNRPEHGFCYEVRWKDEKQRARKRVINPVPKFPEGHPKSTKPGVCGVADSFGFVPPRGEWIFTGNPPAGSDGCTKVSGGEMFYAYNNPKPYSSNTGYDKDNTLVMFFVQDTDYRGYWVVVIDSPNETNFDNGMLELLITSTGLGKDVNVLLFDDVPTGPMGEECTMENIKRTNHGTDCYDWCNDTGTGRFIWRWNKCCTDGMVLGELPSSDFCIEVAVSEKKNLKSLLLADYLSGMIEMSSNVPIDSPVQVCGYECPLFCKRITNCGECTSTPGCGWCPSFGCEAVGAKDGCPEGHNATDDSGWLDSSSKACCPACSLHDTCQDCAAEPGCGWDSHMKRCSSGNEFSREVCQIDNETHFELFAFSVAECLSWTQSQSPTNWSTPRPILSPTLSPSSVLTVGTPTRSPMPIVDTDDEDKRHEAENDDGTRDGDDDDSNDWILWGIPLIFLLLLLACYGRWRYFTIGKKDWDGKFDSIERMTAVGAAFSTSVHAHHNPMFPDEVALNDTQNALVQALRAAKAQDAIIHLNTNCPGIAMELSHKGMCFVKCMEEGGSILDNIMTRSGFTKAMQAVGRMLNKHSSQKVRVDLKVKKLNEWTRHSNPFAIEEEKREFFYNGKLNQVEYCFSGSKRIQRKSDGRALQWQFAPDEFDNFDQVVLLLSKDRWCKLKNRRSSKIGEKEDIMGTYFVNPRTKECVWLE